MKDRRIEWPLKYEVFGTKVSAVAYEEAVSSIVNAAQLDVPAIIAHLNVHMLVAARMDSFLNSRINSFEMLVPDGQPVRWIVNKFHGLKLTTNIRGTDLMLKLCEQSAKMGIGVYLYGSRTDVVKRLNNNLKAKFPSLNIVGFEAPPFRPITSQESKALIDRINYSGADLVFIGLGCPKQELFAHKHKLGLRAVQICVGAAFDFLSGSRNPAPQWMQKKGLEWLFRLFQEPRRLARRYALTNTVFLFLVAKHCILTSRDRSKFSGKISECNPPDES